MFGKVKAWHLPFLTSIAENVWTSKSLICLCIHSFGAIGGNPFASSRGQSFAISPWNLPKYKKDRESTAAARLSRVYARFSSFTCDSHATSHHPFLRLLFSHTFRDIERPPLGARFLSSARLPTERHATPSLLQLTSLYQAFART